MATRTAANALVRRTTFSSAINILPNDISTTIEETTINHNDRQNDVITSTKVKPYSEIPGPKPLPIIGNSWRFAPLIGNYCYIIYTLYTYIYVYNNFN